MSPEYNETSLEHQFFMLDLQADIAIMRGAGLADYLIANIIWHIRAKAIQQEYHRLEQLMASQPPSIGHTDNFRKLST